MKSQQEKQSGSCFVKGLAFIFAILLVIALPLSLLAYDVGRVVFNPPLMKRVLTDEVVNSDLIPVALEWFSDRRAQERVNKGEALTGIDEPDIVLLLSYMDRSDWAAVKQEILPPEILTEWVSVTVDGVYEWIDTSDRNPQVTWNLKSFKERINTSHGVNAIMIAYNNLQPCNQAQIDDFKKRLAAVPAGTEVLYNLCKFPDPWKEDQISDYINSLAKVVKNAPDEFNLTQELASVGNNPEGVGVLTLKNQLRMIRFLMNIAWIIPLVLLILILILVVRSLKTLGKWWGIPLFSGGLFTILPAVVYQWLITSFLAAGPLSETPALVKAEATRAILRVAAEIFHPMLIQAAIIILVALILLIIGSLKKKPKETKS